MADPIPFPRGDSREIGEEESDAIVAVWSGMMRGDLTPLASYLRAGHPLHYTIRRDLADAIDGEFCDGLYKPLKLAKSRPGPGDPLASLEKLARDLNVACFVSKQVQLNGGGVEDAIQAAAEEFDVSRTTVTNAVARVERMALAAGSESNSSEDLLVSRSEIP